MRRNQVLIPSMPKYKHIRRYLRRIDSRRIYSNYGPLYRDLLSRLANLWGLRDENICLLANGTLSLEGAIATSSASAGNWICPSWSFAATGIALKNQVKDFTFVDIDESWRIAPQVLSNVAGVMDVAPFGDEIKVDRFKDFMGTHIIDAAASFDAITKTRTFSTSPFSGVVVSLHATKLIGAGEGGVFISTNSEWVEKVREWASFGFPSLSRESRSNGTNAKFSEYSAAVAHASLDTWPKRRDRLLDLQNTLTTITEKYGFAVHAAMKKGFATPYWIVCAPERALERLAENLKIGGWETRNWWQHGMHEMKLFSDIARESLVNTEKVARTTLGLPFHQFLRNEDIKVIENVFKISRLNDNAREKLDS